MKKLKISEEKQELNAKKHIPEEKTPAQIKAEKIKKDNLRKSRFFLWIFAALFIVMMIFIWKFRTVIMIMPRTFGILFETVTTILLLGMIVSSIFYRAFYRRLQNKTSEENHWNHLNPWHNLY